VNLEAQSMFGCSRIEPAAGSVWGQIPRLTGVYLPIAELASHTCCCSW
jgi:hypothetical protein